MNSTRTVAMLAFALGVISTLAVVATFTIPLPNGLAIATGGVYIVGGIVLYMAIPQEKVIDLNTKITLWTIFVINSVIAGYWTYQLLQAKTLGDQFVMELSSLATIVVWVVASLLFVYRRQILTRLKEMSR